MQEADQSTTLRAAKRMTRDLAMEKTNKMQHAKMLVIK